MINNLDGHEQIQTIALKFPKERSVGNRNILGSFERDKSNIALCQSH
ncbi:hypothetical protein [Nostoc sp.]